MKTVSTQLNVRDIMLTQADRRALEAIQTRNLQQFRGWTAQMETDVIRAVSDGVAAGESIDKISGRISDAINTSNTRARRIARTESINAAVEGARSRYRDYGIEYVEIIACDDWRTCKICQQHDGKVYSVDDDAHMPPYHPNCRCAIKAVVKKDKEKEPAKKAKAPKVPKVPKAPEVPKAVKPLAYKPAKTIAGAEKLLKSHGINTNYEGLAVEAANTVNKTILETMDLAPGLKHSLINSAGTEYSGARVEKDKPIIIKFLEMYFRERAPNATSEQIHKWALTEYMEDFLPSRKSSGGALAFSDPFKFENVDYRGIYLNSVLFDPKNLVETLLKRRQNVLDKFKPVGCDTLKSIIDHELGHEIDRAYNLLSDSKIEEIFATWDKLSDEKKIDALSRYPTT